MKNITVAIITADGTLSFKVVPNTLKSLQGLVGGHIEVTTAPFIPLAGIIRPVCIVNEEGILDGLPMNSLLPMFFGTVVICSARGEEFDSIMESTAKQIAGYMVHENESHSNRTGGGRR